MSATRPARSARDAWAAAAPGAAAAGAAASPDRSSGPSSERATALSASWGQGANQSMLQQLTRAGNWRHLQEEPGVGFRARRHCILIALKGWCPGHSPNRQRTSQHSTHLARKTSPTGLSASARCRQSRTRDTRAAHSPSRVAGQPALVAQGSMSVSALSTSSGASSPPI